MTEMEQTSGAEAPTSPQDERKARAPSDDGAATATTSTEAGAQAPTPAPLVKSGGATSSRAPESRGSVWTADSIAKLLGKGDTPRGELRELYDCAQKEYHQRTDGYQRAMTPLEAKTLEAWLGGKLQLEMMPGFLEETRT